jgi:nitrogen fixation NifU-like protein
MIKGKSADEIDSLRRQFREMVMGKSDADEKSLGSLRALSGVAKFPARVKCALLAWNALEEAQRNHG